MQMIAAVDRNWAIGNRGQMLVTIPADQQFFRQETMGKVVVMGRKTFESLPGRRTVRPPHKYHFKPRPGVPGEGSTGFRKHGRAFKGA